MDTPGIIIIVLLVVNFVFSIIQKNWVAVCGWLIAGLEWTRRLTIG